MLFYQICVSCTKEAVPMFCKAKSRKEKDDLAEKICSETELFNKSSRESYFFVSQILNKKAVLGVISKTPLQRRQLNDYLNTLELCSDQVTVEETTFQSGCHLLRKADANDYILDADDVMDPWGLTELERYRRMQYDECLLQGQRTKKHLLHQAKALLSSSLQEEIERIFAGSTQPQFIGHPVHYVIESDSASARQKMTEILLQALYANSRLESSRYCVIKAENIYREPFKQLMRICAGCSVVLECMPDLDGDKDYLDANTAELSDAMEVTRENRNSVLTVLCLPRACNKLKDFLFSHAGNCTFVEIKEDQVTADQAKKYLRALAKGKNITPDRALYTHLHGEQQVFLPQELDVMFDGWVDRSLRTKIYPQYAEMNTVKKQTAAQKPQGSAYQQLQEMVGLSAAKKTIDQALDFYKAQKLFADKGVQPSHPAMHMVFTGNPGTAKTTVARLFARIMKENGLLSEGKLYEVGRADLVGQFVGWTARIVKDKFKAAKGSVLFIDEAYSLLDDRNGLYGDEAINTIVQEMENMREDIVVIFAGYPRPMEKFLSRNPGLRSRIAFHVPFDNYSPEELYGITKLIAAQKGMCLNELEVRPKLLSAFQDVSRQEDFGNGRYVRNLVEKAMMKQASRLVKMDVDRVTKTDITTLCADDFEIELSKVQPQRRIGF